MSFNGNCTFINIGESSNETTRSLTHSPSLSAEGPQFLRKEAGVDVYRVNLRHRPGRNLGLHICGGCDSSSQPFGGDTPGVFICRVSPLHFYYYHPP